MLQIGYWGHVAQLVGDINNLGQGENDIYVHHALFEL